MNTKEQIVFNSKGWKTINRLGILNENYHTLILNYTDLMNEIGKIESAPEPILLLFNNINLQRYLFNFLASTSALIDICRITMDFYKKTPIYNNYQNNKQNLFVQNKETVFIKDLRNYQMHYKISFPCLSEKNLVSLEVYKLNLYSKWSFLSKEFIKEQGKFIALKPLFENYLKILEPFYMNIYSEIIQYHKNDFKETIMLAKEIDMKLPEIYFKIVQ